ncbi:putative inner membrane transporter RhtA [Proteus penneri ATCC 35198]|nr:putative inner membrane transporter RhtA [Proteus penneri ATCC 35198]
MLLLLLSMLSIQSGASLAKSLFPVIGAPAVTALRLLLGTLILFFLFLNRGDSSSLENRLCHCFYMAYL